MLCAALQCCWAFLLGVVLALLRLWLLGALTNDDLHVVLTTGLAQMRDAGKYVTRAIATMSGVTCIVLFLGCAYVMAVMFLPITVVFASARTMLTLCGKVFVAEPHREDRRQRRERRKYAEKLAKKRQRRLRPLRWTLGKHFRWWLRFMEVSVFVLKCLLLYCVLKLMLETLLLVCLLVVLLLLWMGFRRSE